ncbi:hypothetical protein [Mesorhizobium sp. BHbdii]
MNRFAPISADRSATAVNFGPKGRDKDFDYGLLVTKAAEAAMV